MITKNNFTRIAVRDKEGLLNQIVQDVSWEVTVIDQDEFLQKLPEMEDTIILCFGRGIYDELVKMNNDNKIHIGLRKFNYTKFAALPQVYIGSNKLIFGVKPIFDGDIEQRSSFFFSDAVFKEPLPLPEAQVVGIRVGIQILKEVFLPDLTSWVGIDFETSGLPQEVGFKISGFALSKGNVAYYFDFRKDYDYLSRNRSFEHECEFQMFTEVFKEYLEKNSRNLWAYNCAFEMFVLRRWMNKLYYIQDAMALCVADDKKGSLKYNVQYYLKSPSWDDELALEQDYISAIVGNFSNFTEFKNELYLYFEDRSIKYENKKFPNLQQAMDFYINDIIGKDTGFGKGFFLNMLEDYWNGNAAWYACNPEKLGIYCCYDAFYCEKLAEKIFPAYGNNCYKAFLFNRYIGMELEMGGIHVDMEKALKLRQYCQNIYSNFEIFLNKLYLRYYWKVNRETYKDVQVNRKMIDLFTKYPECMLSNAAQRAKALVQKFLTPELEEEWISTSKPPIHLLDSLFGYDVSDEFSALLGDAKNMENPYMAYGKKAFYTAIDTLVKSYTGIEDFIIKFNKVALNVLKDRIQLSKEKAKKYWFTHLIRIEDAWIVIDTVRAWLKKYGEVLEVEGKKSPTRLIDKINKAFDKAKAEGYFVDSEVNEESLKDIFTVPESVINFVYQLRDTSDPIYLKQDIKEWLPEYIIQGYDGINAVDISAYSCLSKYITELELAKFKSDNYITQDPFVGTVYEGKYSEYEEKICNYWSNDQFPEIMGPIFEKFFKAECMVMNLCWKKLGDDGLQKDKEKVKAYLKSYDEHKTEIFNSLEGREVFISEDPITHDRELIPWKLDFLSNLGSCAEMYYQFLFDNPKGSLNIDLPEDNYELLAKLGVLIDLASVARKEMTTYVKSIINCNHKVFMKDEHGHLTNVGYFSNGLPDKRAKGEEIGVADTYVPHFGINNLVTKRCSSAYNTFLHESNAMECLVVLPGRIKSYFDRLSVSRSHVEVKSC